MINGSVLYSDKIVTVSKFSKDEIIKYTRAQEKKVVVIYNGLSDKFQNSRVGVVSEKYFLFVGNVKPHKNLKRLIKAYKLFLKENTNYKLYIVGQKDGFLTGENNIENEVIGYEEYIKFTGYISDEKLQEYYANTALFIFPSLYEGFGYPILEAMFYSRKIIASHIASISEIGEDKISYFNPYQPEDICMKIKSTLHSETPEYTSQLEKFSLEKMIYNYQRFLKKLTHDIASK